MTLLMILLWLNWRLLFPAAGANLGAGAADTVSKADTAGRELVVYGHELVVWNRKLQVQLCSQLSTYWFSPGKVADNKMEPRVLNA